MQYSCTLAPYWVLVDNMELHWIWDVLAHKWVPGKIIIFEKSLKRVKGMRLNQEQCSCRDLNEISGLLVRGRIPQTWPPNQPDQIFHSDLSTHIFLAYICGERFDVTHGAIFILVGGEVNITTIIRKQSDSRC